MDRQHVEAVKALLTDDLDSHWLGAPSAKPPYRLISQTGGRPFDEMPLCGPNRAFTAFLSLSTVGATPEAAREKANIAKGLLFPGGEPAALSVPGRLAEIEWQAFSAAFEDRDAALLETGYPWLYVDLYLLTSLPA